MSASLYVDRASFLHRLNPSTKLVALLSAIVISFAIPLWWVSVTLILVVVVPMAVLSHVGGRLANLALKLLIPLLVVLFVVQGLTYPSGKTVLFQLGFLSLTTEGLGFALGIGSRVALLVLAAMLLVVTTHPGDLMTSLTERGMSPKIAYIISSSLQLIPAFQDRANAILLAQQARGLTVGGGFLNRTRAMLPLLGPLVLGMFTDVEERSNAMEARGFGSASRRTTLVPVPDSKAQQVARWVIPLVTVGLVAFYYVWRAL